MSVGGKAPRYLIKPQTSKRMGKGSVGPKAAPYSRLLARCLIIFNIFEKLDFHFKTDNV